MFPNAKICIGIEGCAKEGKRSGTIRVLHDEGYELAAGAQITTAMEDYLEMICRLDAEKPAPSGFGLCLSNCTSSPSSASKMVSNLREKGLVTAEKIR